MDCNLIYVTLSYPYKHIKYTSKPNNPIPGDHVLLSRLGKQSYGMCSFSHDGGRIGSIRNKQFGVYSMVNVILTFSEMCLLF